MPSFNFLGLTVWISIGNKQDHRHLSGLRLYIVDICKLGSPILIDISNFRALGNVFLKTILDKIRSEYSELIFLK